ncbi:unnamed protein product [Vicia faba]|uniref:Reverse transcriptase n=1 Tax=Vicia faba TaxID=3906 RepID=A0AAV0YV17_VICFA|nr:unnamed protein product [Vicia faba]
MKMVSKAIANRIKSLLPEIIHIEQSTFVGGRLISNNVFVAMECFHWMKKKKGKKGVMALKLDMAKAYDRVEWSFVEGVLRVARRAPSISHLLFADDSLLFARANLLEAGKVMDVLATYQKSSGKMVNLDKSEASFS